METLINFYQVTENIGTSGQPTKEQFTKISGQGYSSVINLAMHNSDNAIPEEGNIVASLGMSYFHIPVPFDQPAAEHLKKFFRLMTALEGEKVFVHCALNLRVSVFVYKYFTVCKGVAEGHGMSPILKKWLPTMDEKWKSILNMSAEDVGL